MQSNFTKYNKKVTKYLLQQKDLNKNVKNAIPN